MADAVTTLAPARARRAVRAPRPWALYLSLAFLALVAFLAIAGSLVAPHDPSSQDLLAGLSTPSSAHLLGTDDLGRDIFSRLLYGARTAVVGPLLIAAGAGVLSVAIGLFAGYRGGLVDGVAMRAADFLLALPALLVIIVVAGVVGGGYALSVVLLIALATPWDARIVRAATLEQTPRAYVESATVLGLSGRRTMWRHIFPNILPIVVVSACLDFTYGLVSLSGLSFLGIGVAPGSADWGRMLADNRNLVFQNPASAVAPALCILLTAAAMNIVGDWLYERLSERGRAR